MVKQAKINRGEKWVGVRAKAVFEKMDADVKWIDANECIQADIAAYKDTLQTKSKVKK